MKHALDSTFFRRNTSQRMRRTLAARVALSAALAFSGVAVAEQCKPVSGTFTLAPLIPCPDGVVALGCFQGAFDGNLKGTSISGLTSLQPVHDHPGTMIFTARSTIQLPGGTVTTTDAGIGTDCQPVGTQFVCASSNEILAITSGTGKYAGAYGTIFLSGPYMSGNPYDSLGAYQGQICTGKPKRD
jgi:hypothetical protein